VGRGVWGGRVADVVAVEARYRRRSQGGVRRDDQDDGEARTLVSSRHGRPAEHLGGTHDNQ